MNRNHRNRTYPLPVRDQVYHWPLHNFMGDVGISATRVWEFRFLEQSRRFGTTASWTGPTHIDVCRFHLFVS